MVRYHRAWVRIFLGLGLESWARYGSDKYILDLGSIRSSQRNGLSTPYRLTYGVVWDCTPWHAGILIMVQQVSLMMFSLNIED